MVPFRHLRQRPRQNLRDVVPLKKPFSLTIDPSSICNFRCIQCLHGSNNLKNLIDLQLMKLDVFKKIIDDIRVWNGPKLKVIKLYNCGEPLINRNFVNMLKYAKDADVAERIDLTSNCSLLTPAISEKLVEYGLDYLRVSIYSPVQEKHEKITNNSIDIKTIRNNLLHLREIKKKHESQRPFVAIKMFESVSEEENRIFLDTYSDLADEIFYEHLHNFTDMEGTDFLKAYYGDQKDSIVDKMDLKPVSRNACPWPFMTLTVQSNGDVNVCCIDWVGNTRVGNVSRQSIQEIWEGDALYEFRKMQLENRRHENPSCKNCNIYLTDHFTVDNIDGFPVEQLRKQQK